MYNRRENKVLLYTDKIIFDPPISADNIGKLSKNDKMRIIKFVGMITGIEEPSNDRILDFLELLGLRK